jgi:hypothetical protein
VASAVRSELSDQTIARALKDPALAVAAAIAAETRQALADRLLAELRAVDPTTRGDVIAAIVAALDSTEAGRKALGSISSDPRYSGFIQRQASLRAVNAG